MPRSYQPYAPDQDILLPQSLQEWLPAGHLAHYISDTIDALDLSAFFKPYEGGGARNQPFHPAQALRPRRKCLRNQGGHSNVPSVNPRPKRRTTSPTPTVAS